MQNQLNPLDYFNTNNKDKKALIFKNYIFKISKFDQNAWKYFNNDL